MRAAHHAPARAGVSRCLRRRSIATNVSPMPDALPRQEGLAALEAELRRDLARLNFPADNWVPRRTHGNGAVADVVIVGAGMAGLAAAVALLRQGVRNLRVLDRSMEGLEGPWMTFARMETLRSPKELVGPAVGLAAATFRAWFEAQHGAAAWDGLYRIPRPMWMGYLRWYRRALALPVQNGVEVDRIRPQDGLLRLDLAAGAAAEVLMARKVVLALGRPGLGRPAVPSWVEGLPRDRWAHTSDPINFAALRGRRVVVVGAGSSAMDNAAEALDAGCARLDMVLRRPALPRINKLMGAGNPGFTAAFPGLPDAWRWRFMLYGEQTQTPPPHNSTQRVGRHPNAHLHPGTPVLAMRMQGDAIHVETARGALLADFAILGTGFRVDTKDPPGLLDGADQILTWAKRYSPPPDEESAELGRYPYLGPRFEFQERETGRAPWLRHVLCFNHAASLSLGKVSGDIPKVGEGAAWLAEGIAATLYEEDLQTHWLDLLDYAKPELLGDEWTPARPLD